MKAERNNAPNTLRGTLLLRIGELADSRKAPSSSSGRRLPAFIPQKGISIVKKLKERGLKPPREAARSLQVSRFFVEIWERESAPAELILRKPIA